MDDAVKLAACPFCGRHTAHVVMPYEGIYSVQCDPGCASRGAITSNSDAAITAWNTRAPSPSEAALKAEVERQREALTDIEETCRGIMPIHRDMDHLLTIVVDIHQAEWTRLFIIYATARAALMQGKNSDGK